jgi:hypothetical protein
MALIGRQLTNGNYLKLDNISSQFNNTQKTFNLTTAGQPFYPGSVFSVLISVGDVIQEPATSYTIDQATITFTSAPTTGSAFFGIVLGLALNIGVPADGTVTGTKLSLPFNYNSGLLYLDSVNNRVGILSTSPTVALDVVGNSRVSGITNLNGLSVSGISTLGTVQISSGIVTASSGIVTYYGDGSKLSNIISGVSISTNTTNQSQYLTYVTGTGSTTGFGITTTGLVFNPSSGNLGIGTTNPTSKLTVTGDVLVSGVITASNFSGNASSATYATNAGIATYATNAGIATFATSAGIATYATSSGIATYATSSGVSTSVIGGIGSITQLQVTGVSTFSNGPVLIGSATSTGTASQRLQVTGGAYVSGKLGIGVTNTSYPLEVSYSGTDSLISGIFVGGGVISRANGTLKLASGTQGGGVTGNSILLGNLDGIILDGGSSYTSGIELKGGGGNIKVTQGNLLVGTATSTGTASQPLQVTGGAYVSGNLGVGTISPTSKLHVVGDVRVTGVITATTFVGALTGTATSTTNIPNLTGDITSVNSVTSIAAGVIVDADINASAGIVDTKLATISTALKVSNSATTATNANTASAIVARDASGNFSAGTITASLTGAASLNVLKAGDTMTGQLISTLANSTTTGGGQIYLNGATGNRIDFNVNGAAAPSFTTRSAGTKIVLYPNVSGSSVDYAIGLDSLTFWNSVDTSASSFKWYAGTTNIATLFGTGQLVLGTTSLTGTASQPLQVTGGAYVSGNLGVGVANPSYKLSVNGNASFNGSQSSPAYIYANGGGDDSSLFIKGGSSAGVWSQIEVTGNWNGSSQTGGKVAFYTAGAEKARLDASGNLGIGLTNPGSKLQIVGDIRFGKQDYSYQAIQKVATLNADGVSGVYPPASFRFYTYPGAINTTTLKLGIRGQDDTNGETSDIITIVSTSASSGYVGIGTTVPLQKLHVNGNLLVSAGSSTGQHITQKAYELNSGTLSWEGSAGQLFSITNNLTSGSIFSVNDVSGIPSIDVNADGTVLVAPYGGNLGVGTISPTAKLHVSGDAKINDITVGKGSGTNTTGTPNTAVGYQALISNANGYSSTAVGYLALYSNTTGYYNTATGSQALRFNTTGNQNTANGDQALYSNTTGSANTANGQQTLRLNTTGSYNTANGFAALSSNTTGYHNIANGYSALLFNTTGIRNTATGNLTLRSNTIGIYNTATGFEALYSNTTGINNTATGMDALYYNTIGTENTADGCYALYRNTTGTRNTAVGLSALFNNTTGSNNVATGYQALYSATTASGNTANGYQALYSATDGQSNTATGHSALRFNTGGISNNATGSGALYSNTTGNQNTAIGHIALYSNTNGYHNTANGYRALMANTTGNYNTATGSSALRFNTNGYHNTANGYRALYSNTTGTKNTATGYYAGNTNTTGTNNTFLGNNAVNTAGGVTASDTIVLGNSSVTTLRCQTATISALSDARDKKDVIDIPLGLDFLNDLRPVKFTWNQRDRGRIDLPDSGFIAQEALETVMNYDADWFGLVDHQNPEHFELSPAKLIPVLVKAVQELSQQNQELKALIDSIVEKT